jgi:hypothetical protein
VDIANAPPRINDRYRIYQFFGRDPEGCTLEWQAFLHPVPIVTLDPQKSQSPKLPKPKWTDHGTKNIYTLSILPTKKLEQQMIWFLQGGVIYPLICMYSKYTFLFW